jgi:hypothetical protein
LERAGWRTVSFSEIDPYACAVLAERWPGVPQLGDIVNLADAARGSGESGRRGTGGYGTEDLHGVPIDDERQRVPDDGRDDADSGKPTEHDGRGDWRSATLWSGGSLPRREVAGGSPPDLETTEGGDAAWKSATLWSGGFP